MSRAWHSSIKWTGALISRFPQGIQRYREHRAGANPWRVIDQLRGRLRLNAAALQIPIGAEDGFEGVVDLVQMKAIRNTGEKGIKVEESDEIPAHLKELADQKKAELIETVADADDALAELFIEEKPITPSDLIEAIRRTTLARTFTPVFMGTALGNTGVQALLDGVCTYLPTPAEVPSVALDVSQSTANPTQVALSPASAAPLVALAFKLEEGKYGQLTYIRVYQGTLKKGGTIFNTRTGKKVKLPRLVRMHSEEMEDVEALGAGEICATFGVECSSGDTFTDGNVPYSMVRGRAL
jgi:elongation factor G